MTMHRRILRLSSANCFRIVAFLALAGAASTVRAAECEWTRSGAVRVTPQGQATYMIGQVPATHRAQLRDGFALRLQRPKPELRPGRPARAATSITLAPPARSDQLLVRPAVQRPIAERTPSLVSLNATP